MKRLLCLVVILLVQFSAHAEGVTLLAGVSQFQDHGDGIWYQEKWPYKLKLRTESLGLRYDTKIINGISYSFGYMHLGNVTSSAEAVANDANYDSVKHECIGTCWPTSHWYGSGNVQGIFGTRVHSYGPWSFEYGIYLYRPSWSVHIPDYVWKLDQPRVDITVNNSPHLQITPMLGVRYAINNKWSMNFMTVHTQSEKSEFSSLYMRQTYNISIGYTF